ncbi:MAG: decarboxylating 6-phosphogluconate dehydrogenase [Capsulimonadaceae bacterium]|nr:decarboxylating 6-phosphogluconate dehydrogenase [Capsulimonadaceae bacterium]
MLIGLIGLGKMGLPMAQRIMRGGHSVVGYDMSEDRKAALREAGGSSVSSLEELAAALPGGERIVWAMVPAGDPVDETICNLRLHLDPEDIIVDGGNSYYKDTVRRAKSLRQDDIYLIDSGTSGGVWGLENGYCLMVGGETNAYNRVRPILEALAPEGGLVHTGAPGSGHYTKMVHNGIEYGLLQAYGEGFEILGASEFPLNLLEIAQAWRNGSVVRSWLLDLLARSFEADPNLERVKGYVEDSGEGRWTIQEAIEHNVPAPVITASLYERFHSRKPDSFSAKVIASLRNQFGGHAVLHQSVADATGSGSSSVETGVSEATMGTGD